MCNMLACLFFLLLMNEMNYHLGFLSEHRGFLVLGKNMHFRNALLVLVCGMPE